MDTFAEVAKQPDPMAPPQRDANVTQDALWNAHRWLLLRELVGPEGEAAVDAWQDAEAQAHEDHGVIEFETGRMLHAEPW